MKKITSFYFLDYPNKLPNDPSDAESEVRVEVGGPTSTLHNFEDTYRITVSTIKPLARQLQRSNSFVALRSLLLVERFDVQTIQTALDQLLPSIDQFAEKLD